MNFLSMGEGGSAATVDDPSPETASYEDCTLWVRLLNCNTGSPTSETQTRSELAVVLVCQFFERGYRWSPDMATQDLSWASRKAKRGANA